MLKFPNLIRKKKQTEENTDEPIESVEQVTEEAPASKKNKRSGILRRRTILVLLLCVVSAAAFFLYLFTREFKGYKIVRSTETGYENTATYIRFAGNLLKYTPDGASYINANGDVVWTTGINMKQPVAVSSGDYAAIADLNGNTVCIFNAEGEVSNLTMPHAICDVDVADQGAFAVVLESDKTNYINLYNKRGEMVYEIQTTIDKSGYPFDITISDNGEKLFTSYLTVGAKGMENKLAAYNFGDVGQNSNADRMVGGYLMEGQTVPKVQFVNNDTVCAFGTNSIELYSMREKPKHRDTIMYRGDVQSIFYSEKFVGCVLDLRYKTGTETDAEDEQHKYRIYAYNLKGRKTLDKYIDFEYDNIYASDKEIIVTGGSDCMIFRANGSVKFTGKLDGHIVSMVPAGGSQEYVVVYENHTDTIKLKRSETKKVEE